MIDTIKLSIEFSKRPHWAINPKLFKEADAESGVFKALVNPSSINKKLGLYIPRLTYLERPNRYKGRTCTANIELSLPKLIYKNNFDELTDKDFSKVTRRLKESLKKHCGIWLTTEQIEKARVSKVDYSKNIIFPDRTPVSTLIEKVQMADISKTYDTQKTNFRNGGLL